MINWQDYEGRTALHLAVADGNEAVVNALVSGCQGRVPGSNIKLVVAPTPYIFGRSMDDHSDDFSRLQNVQY